MSRFPCCTVNASVCSSSDANLIGQLATGNTTTRAVDDHERGHAAVAAHDPSKRLTVFGITRCFCATKTGQCCCLNTYLPNSPQTRCVNCRGLHVCSKKGMNFAFSFNGDNQDHAALLCEKNRSASFLVVWAPKPVVRLASGDHHILASARARRSQVQFCAVVRETM